MLYREQKNIGIEYETKEVLLEHLEELGSIPSHCPIFNVPLVILKENNKQRHPQSPSIDRIDPKKGYIRSNIRIISWRANEIKGNATLEEVKMILEDLEKRKRDEKITVDKLGFSWKRTCAMCGKDTGNLDWVICDKCYNDEGDKK